MANSRVLLSGAALSMLLVALNVATALAGARHP